VWPHPLYIHLNLHCSPQCCLATIQGILHNAWPYKLPHSHRVKSPRSHKIAVMSRNSSSLCSNILSTSPPSTSLQQSKDFQRLTLKTSGPVSRMTSSGPLSTKAGIALRPVTKDSSMEAKSVSSSSVSKIPSSKSKVSLPARQIWNSSLLKSVTSHGLHSEDLTSSITSSINVQSTLITDLSTADQEVCIDQIGKERSHTNRNGIAHHHNKSSQLGELQKWITEL